MHLWCSLFSEGKDEIYRQKEEVSKKRRSLLWYEDAPKVLNRDTVLFNYFLPFLTMQNVINFFPLFFIYHFNVEDDFVLNLIIICFVV